MNPEAQAALDAILKKEPRELDADERAFLRARASYLKESQKEEYKVALQEETKPLVEPETVKENDKKSN